MVLTVYFALVASSSPSLSQLIIGLGFPWAEQLSRVLPPSFASTYCGGVAVNEGGAAERVRVGGGVIHGKVNISTAMFQKLHRPEQETSALLLTACFNHDVCVDTIIIIIKKPPYGHIKVAA